jgi:hypothetical protein
LPIVAPLPTATACYPLVAGVRISFTGIFTKRAAMPGPAIGAIRMLVAAMVLTSAFSHEAHT